MSGGSLNYFFISLEEHVGDFKDKELDELVKDLARLFHDREWYLSSDTSIGNWCDSRDAFKAKWFGGNRSERIERYIQEFCEEARDEFGLSRKYCRYCANWYNSEKHDELYGDCKKHPRCLWHRSESCDEWEGKEEC